MPQRLSIIMPTLDESHSIETTLRSLQPRRQAGHEIIVVDGGSQDNTTALAAPLADQVIHCSRGRGRQMNAGAARAQHAILLFLHADTLLPATAVDDICTALENGKSWGHFDVRIVPEDGLLRIVAAMMNLRSRLTGIATGDQAIFVKRDLFDVVGRYPEISLMEDLALCDKLKRYSTPGCLRSRVITSARRWQRQGRVKTIVKMWCLRLAYRLGADPDKLARFYR